MPLGRLLECIAQSLAEKGRTALVGAGSFVDVMPNIAHALFASTSGTFREAEIRQAFQQALDSSAKDFHTTARNITANLSFLQSSSYRAQVTTYLEQLPRSIRSVLRRPCDPDGNLVPDKLRIDHPEDWLLYLPPRLVLLQLGEVVPGVDDWELNELIALDHGTEIWQGWDDLMPEMSPTLLKFPIDIQLQQLLISRLDVFEFLLSLEPFTGMVPLRGVYFESTPPCIETEFVPGYDVGGMIRDWAWRYDHPRPDYAIRLIKRIAEIVGNMHRHNPPIVHRDLKPTNILINPTGEGRFTVWVSDLGWGQIRAEHLIKEMQLGNHAAPRGDIDRATVRGGNSLLYASPQMLKGEPPDPRDDVYALGVLWYQLLKRNATVTPPPGHEWTLEFRPHGFNDSQAQLLASCLAAKAQSRPADALVLMERIEAMSKPEPEPAIETRSFVLKGSSTYKPLIPVGTSRAGGDNGSDEYSRSKILGLNGLPHMLRNSVGMNMVLIPPGSYEMGSPPKELGRLHDEGPVHTVTFAHSFYLGMTAVTQSQYEQVMGRNPSHFNRWHGGGIDHPVEQVKWDEAVAFCARLTARPQERDLGFLYRLPTEAEWEYACRAGTTTPFAFGSSLNGQQARFLGSDSTQFQRLGSGGKTVPVGSFVGNPFGLLDMHGNVLEWCADWYSENYYEHSPEADPTGPQTGTLKVLRGGSWSQFPGECRSAARLGQTPDKASNAIGFRVVLTLSDNGIRFTKS